MPTPPNFNPADTSDEELPDDEEFDLPSPVSDALARSVRYWTVGAVVSGLIAVLTATVASVPPAIMLSGAIAFGLGLGGLVAFDAYANERTMTVADLRPYIVSGLVGTGIVSVGMTMGHIAVTVGLPFLAVSALLAHVAMRHTDRLPARLQTA
jgi:hypothetical protein